MKQFADKRGDIFLSIKNYTGALTCRLSRIEIVQPSFWPRFQDFLLKITQIHQVTAINFVMGHLENTIWGLGGSPEWRTLLFVLSLDRNTPKHLGLNTGIKVTYHLLRQMARLVIMPLATITSAESLIPVLMEKDCLRLSGSGNNSASKTDLMW